MKLNLKKGFTLIELLVVIAIIGILSGIVLSSLNTARNKGADAGVKANLASVRTQAELLYNNNGCYTASGACNATTPAVVTAGNCTASGLFGDTTIAAQIAAAKSAGGGLVSCAATVGGTQWAAAAHTKTTGTGWCVDSTGKSQAISGLADQAQATLDAKVSGGACN